MPPRKRTRSTVAGSASEATFVDEGRHGEKEEMARNKGGRKGRGAEGREGQDTFLHAFRKELEQQAPPGGWTRHGIEETFGFALEGLPEGNEKRRLEEDTERCVKELCQALGVGWEPDDQPTQEKPPVPLFLEKGYLKACQALAPLDLKPIDAREGVLFARMPPDEQLIDKYVESQRPVGITELEQISRLATTFVNAHADRGVHALDRLIAECRGYMSKLCEEGRSPLREQKLGRLERLLIGLSTSLSISTDGEAEKTATEYWPALANVPMPGRSSVIKMSSHSPIVLAQLTVSLCELKLQRENAAPASISSELACLIAECTNEITSVLLEERLPIVCGATREEKVWSILYEALSEIPTSSDGSQVRQADTLGNHLQYLQGLRIARKASKHLKAAGQGLRSAEILSTAAAVAPPFGFLGKLKKSVGRPGLLQEDISAFLVYRVADEELKRFSEQLKGLSSVVKYHPSGAEHDNDAVKEGDGESSDTEEEEEPTFFIDKTPAEVKPMELLPEGSSFPRSVVDRLDAGEGSDPGSA